MSHLTVPPLPPSSLPKTPKEKCAWSCSLRRDIMVICAALGLIACLGALAWYSERLPGEAVGIISTVAGIFGSCLKDVYTFEFGSSRGSKLKDSTVAHILQMHRQGE